MRKKIDGAPWHRGHRDYFWFALILMAVLIGSAARGIVSGETQKSPPLQDASLSDQ